MTATMRRATCLAALAFAALLAGCVSTTEITQIANVVPPAQPGHTLLVVGATPDDRARARYEKAFLAELHRAGIEGVGSATLIPSVQGLDSKALHEKMMQFTDRADLVIHVQLVALTQSRTWSPTDYTRDGKPVTADIAGVPVTLNAPQDPVGAQTDVELQANLYQAATQKLLWTATTVTHEANDFESVARSQARAVIRELVSRGYLQKR